MKQVLLGHSSKIYCFTGNVFNPNMRIRYFLIIDLCTINLCLFKEDCICLCLFSQARPFLFHSANRFQYSYPNAISAAMEMKNVWLARLTCLANNQNSHNLARYQALKTMSGTVQKMQKQ